MPIRTLIFLLTLLSLVGCKTDSEHQLRSMFKETMRDQRELTSPDQFEEREERDETRRERVHSLVEDDGLDEGAEYFYAAVILVTSTNVDDLELSRELAQRAAELGENKALAVAAEATDKSLMVRGLPQRYGTQYVFDPLLGRWELYRLDPTTSDEERAKMGIPPLSVLNDRVAYLNQNRPKPQ